MLSPARVADGRLSRLESNALHARQSAGAADHRLLTFRRYTGYPNGTIPEDRRHAGRCPMRPNLGLIAEARSNDAAAIEKAAERLRVDEFGCSALAHRHWFGADPGAKALERVFVAYLFRGEAPMWVRRISRGILRRTE